MTAPINVHEVMGLLGRSPGHYEVRISAHNWWLQDKGVAVFASGKTAGELRTILEERAVPTAENAAEYLDRIVVPGILNDYSPETVAAWRIVHRFIKAHRT